MKLYYLLPFVLGFIGVLQGTINKQLANSIGLSYALLFNSILVLILAGGLLLFGFFPGKFSFSELKWWAVLPGLFGFMIILGAPIAIAKLGALNTFLIIVLSQIIVSGLWDQFVENIAISWTRVVGSFIVFLGAWLATK